MNINATLLVQIGNFLIAYFLFRHILLKPGYHALREKQRQQESLRDMVVHDKRIIEEARQQQKDAWSQFRTWCNGYCPPLVRKLFFFRGITVTITPPIVSAAHKKKVSDQLVGTLMTSLKERYDE